ncbi:MAG: tetratricopeptide repeat protein [Geminicoccaceae bacterium]
MMRWVGVVVAAWLAGTALVQAAGLDDLERGTQAFKEGEHERAIALFTSAIESGDLDDQRRGIALTLRGVAYGNIEAYQRAIDDYTAALAVRPSSALAYTRRGVARINLGQFEQAVDDFERAIEIKPDNALARENLAIAQAALEGADPITAAEAGAGEEDAAQAEATAGADDPAVSVPAEALQDADGAPLPAQGADGFAGAGDVDVPTAVAPSTSDAPSAAGGVIAAPDDVGDPSPALSEQSAETTLEATLNGDADSPPAPSDDGAFFGPDDGVADGEPGALEPEVEAPLALDEPVTVDEVTEPQVREPAQPSADILSEPRPQASDPLAPGTVVPPAPRAERAPAGVADSVEPLAESEPVPDPEPLPEPPAQLAEPEPEPAPQPAIEPAPPAPPAPTLARDDDPINGMYRAPQGVNVRAGAANEHPVMDQLSAGQVVEVRGIQLGWYRVVLPDGREGYVYQRWLERVE